MKLPALTLWQPWATFVINGLKPWETRTHNRYKSLKGKRIAIHAAARMPKQEELCQIVGFMNSIPVFEFNSNHRWTSNTYQLGVVLGTAVVSDVFKMLRVDECRTLCAYSPDRWCYSLTHVRKFSDPIPAKGKQGIWTFEYDGWNERAL